MGKKKDKKKAKKELEAAVVKGKNGNKDKKADGKLSRKDYERN